MTDERDHLTPDDQPMSAEEASAIDQLENRLVQERPIPHPGFRAMLRTELLGESGSRGMVPRRRGALIAAYASTGLALLAFAAVGVFGAGPLAA